MQFRDRHFFVRLYTQYVRPHLEFAFPAWSPWSLSDKECLERVQRRGIRMVSGISGNSYEERLKELGLTTLKERRHRLDMIQTYKIVRGHEKVQRDPWFQKASDSKRPFRQAAGPHNLKPKASRLDVRRNFFSQHVVSDWNKFPMELKMVLNSESFKKAM
jgi:hypothetical protein